jgi:hypothetical protein
LSQKKTSASIFMSICLCIIVILIFVDSAAIYIMVVKFRNNIWPPPPQLSLHRRAALSSKSNGTRSVYNRENPKISLYCEMSMDKAHEISLYYPFTMNREYGI